MSVRPGRSLVRISAAASAAVLLLAVAATAGTFVVDDDGGPGVDFTAIQPAVDAALPGDLILVRDGEYAFFSVDKGVRVVAEAGHTPVLDGTGVEIHDVPAGQAVALAGFEIDWISVHDCIGDVLIDGCTVSGSVGISSLRVHRCELVVVSRTTIDGRNGTQDSPGFPVFNAQRAAEALDSTVVWSACNVEGGRGGTYYKSDGKPGMPAIEALRATLLIQASLVFGGTGGSYWGPDPSEFDCDGGDGAPALVLDDCFVELHGRAADLVRGGDTGEPSWIGGLPGDPANAIVAEDSEVLHSGVTLATFGGMPAFAGVASSLTEVAPAVPPLTLAGDALLGGSFEPVLEAAPGAQFLLWISPFAGVQPVGNKHTQLLLAPAQLFPLAAGTVGPSGVFDLPLTLPDSPLLQGLALHLQAYVRLGPGADVLSTSASCLLR